MTLILACRYRKDQESAFVKALRKRCHREAKAMQFTVAFATDEGNTSTAYCILLTCRCHPYYSNSKQEFRLIVYFCSWQRGRCCFTSPHDLGLLTSIVAR